MNMKGDNKIVTIIMACAISLISIITYEVNPSFHKGFINSAVKWFSTSQARVRSWFNAGGGGGGGYEPFIPSNDDGGWWFDNDDDYDDDRSIFDIWGEDRGWGGFRGKKSDNEDTKDNKDSKSDIL